jgi:uncharacterized membrane protein YbaN (DUF454 family)
MSRLVKIITGWFFLILGFIGCFLPILQGFLFMAVGLLFLADESPLIKKYFERFERKYPEQYRKALAFRESLKHKFRKLIHRK